MFDTNIIFGDGKIDIDMNNEITTHFLHSRTSFTRPASARQRLALRSLRQMADDELALAASTLLINTETTAPLPMSTSPLKSPFLESPNTLLKRYGFVESSCDESAASKHICSARSSIENSDELSNLSVIAADGEERFQLSREYMGAWCEQFSAVEQQDQSEGVFQFPGDGDQLNFLISLIDPAAHPSNLSADRLTDVLRLCSQWPTHESVTEAACYFAHRSQRIAASEKLQLASMTGNRLLIFGALDQCTSRQHIFKIVTDLTEGFGRIAQAPHASPVLASMLEHAANDGSGQYLQMLASRHDSELMALKRKLREPLDFSQPDQWRRTELLVDDDRASLFVNRAYLAHCSPVLKRAFYGNFSERRQSRVRLGSSMAGLAASSALAERTSPAAFSLFLTLLHPSLPGAMLKLLPLNSTNSADCQMWADELFECVFDRNIDRLMDVFRLAHRYEALRLQEACVWVLELKGGLDLAERLLMADAYHLTSMMARCVADMRSAGAIKRLLADNETLLQNLSCACHRLVLDRLLALI